MLKKISQFIETKRGSEKIYWIFTIIIKDFLYWKIWVRFFKREVYFSSQYDSSYINIIKKSSGILHIGAHL